MKKVFFSLLLAVASMAAMSQDKDKVVADETTLTDMKSSIKIETENELVFKRILTDFEEKMISYMVKYKKDRKGRYKAYAIYFKLEDKPEVVAKMAKY